MYKQSIHTYCLITTVINMGTITNHTPQSPSIRDTISQPWVVSDRHVFQTPIDRSLRQDAVRNCQEPYWPPQFSWARGEGFASGKL